MAFLELTRMKEETNFSKNYDINVSNKETLKNIDDEVFSEQDQNFSLKTNESSSFYDTFREKQ